ncbi:MAG TPA: DNA/RNA non-specific endonuclease, partial [Planctomycetia bacterium]|nr:DNA/RNA non-specific endonuclease [Planctomycetia bacterium]
MDGRRNFAQLAAAALALVAAAAGQTPPRAPAGNPTRIAGAQGAPLSPDLHLAMGAPTRPMTASGREATALIKRPQSVISYSDRLRTATWAAWHLGPRSLPPNRKFLRQPFFTVDPLLPKGFVAIEHGEYGADGFDRGHLVPAADRSLTQEDNETTFLTTNILPQELSVRRQRTRAEMPGRPSCGPQPVAVGNHRLRP